MENIIPILSGFFIAIGSLIGSIVTIRKVKIEIEKEKANIANAGVDLTTDIIGQAKEWLGQQGVYIDSLIEQVGVLRKEVSKLHDEMTTRDAEYTRREEQYQAYIRYLLRNIKDLTQQLCDLDAVAIVTPVSFEKFKEA